mmetsp:Transcript_15086/g.29122  ORF Transcript_15086/g.29122 Transcript_15086/m.29122 type:complete len:93 (+) Transcript_15086:315-593(+)
MCLHRSPGKRFVMCPASWRVFGYQCSFWLADCTSSCMLAKGMAMVHTSRHTPGPRICFRIAGCHSPYGSAAFHTLSGIVGKSEVGKAFFQDK